jgi:hypothetical protein
LSASKFEELIAASEDVSPPVGVVLRLLAVRGALYAEVERKEETGAE